MRNEQRKKVFLFTNSVTGKVELGNMEPKRGADRNGKTFIDFPFKRVIVSVPRIKRASYCTKGASFCFGFSHSHFVRAQRETEKKYGELHSVVVCRVVRISNFLRTEKKSFLTFSSANKSNKFGILFFV